MPAARGAGIQKQCDKLDLPRARRKEDAGKPEMAAAL
jgi:hypothetical protein